MVQRSLTAHVEDSGAAGFGLPGGPSANHVAKTGLPFDLTTDIDAIEWTMRVLEYDNNTGGVGGGHSGTTDATGNTTTSLKQTGQNFTFTGAFYLQFTSRIGTADEIRQISNSSGNTINWTEPLTLGNPDSEAFEVHNQSMRKEMFNPNFYGDGPGENDGIQNWHGPVNQGADRVVDQVGGTTFIKPGHTYDINIYPQDGRGSRGTASGTVAGAEGYSLVDSRLTQKIASGTTSSAGSTTHLIDTGPTLRFPRQPNNSVYLDPIGQDTGAGVVISGNNTITKSGGESFITFGFTTQVTITNAEDAGNNGTYTLTNVTANALTVSGTPLTNNADDNTIVLWADGFADNQHNNYWVRFPNRSYPHEWRKIQDTNGSAGSNTIQWSTMKPLNTATTSGEPYELWLADHTPFNGRVGFGTLNPDAPNATIVLRPDSGVPSGPTVNKDYIIDSGPSKEEFRDITEVVSPMEVRWSASQPLTKGNVTADSPVSSGTSLTHGNRFGLTDDGNNPDLPFDGNKYKNYWVRVRPGQTDEQWRLMTLTFGSVLAWATQLPYKMQAGDQYEIYQQTGTLYDFNREDGYHINGLEVLADPNTFPRWRRVFVDADALNRGTQTQTGTSEGKGGLMTYPRTWQFRLTRTGTITSPTAQLCKRWEDDAWCLLQAKPGNPWETGNYTIWTLQAAVDGVWTTVYRNYVDTRVADRLRYSYPFTILQETNHANLPNPMSNAPTETRYYGIKIRADGRWYLPILYIMQAGGFDHPDADDEYGWAPENLSTDSGELSYKTGHATDATTQHRTQGTMFITNVSHEKTGPATLLPSQGDLTYGIGTFSASGYVWRDGPSSGFPWIMHDKNRGMFIITPDSTRDGQVVYTVPYDGTYYLNGRFANYHPSSPSGNGVDVSVITDSGTVWGPVHVNEDSIPDEEAPFSDARAAEGGVQSFTDLTIPDLLAGDKIRFNVSALGANGFDTTAFMFDVSYTAPSIPGGVDPTTLPMDENLEWLGRDIIITWTEPDFSAEYQPDEPTDINSGLDPLVRSFSLDVFDPATNITLRQVRGLQERTYTYTKEMNQDDQYAAFGRKAQRELAFRVWMESVTDRTSSSRSIAVFNPAPVAPAGVSLTSTPGDAAKGLSAIVHATISPGASADDPDFVGYAIWWSETQGFTPAPSNFGGVGSIGSTRLSIPVSSGVPIYVRIAGYDDFHEDPRNITDPLSVMNFLNEVSITTVDAASLPIDSDGLAPDAVSGVLVLSGHNATGNLLANRGKVSLSASAIYYSVDEGGSGGLVVTRTYYFDSVLFYDSVTSTWTDYTTQSQDATPTDVAAPITNTGDPETSDALYIGNVFPFGTPEIDVDSDGSFGTSSQLIWEYFNNVSWVPIPGVSDSTRDLESSFGKWEWTPPNDWAANKVNDVGPYYWIRVRQIGSAGGGANPTAIDELKVFYNVVGVPSFSAPNQRFASAAVTLTAHAKIEPCKDTETLTVSAAGAGKVTLVAHANKDRSGDAV